LDFGGAPKLAREGACGPRGGWIGFSRRHGDTEAGRSESSLILGE